MNGHLPATTGGRRTKHVCLGVILGGIGLGLPVIGLVIASGAWTGSTRAGETTTIPRQQRMFRPLNNANLNPITYRDPRDGDEFYPININNWWGHVSQGGDIIIFPSFDWTDYRYEHLIRAMKDGKTGFLRGSGEFSIDPTYAYADRFAEGKAIVGNGEGQFTYINKAGRTVTDLRFDGALRFSEHVAAVQVGDRVGYVNSAGKWLVKPRFVQGRSFHNGVAAVKVPKASARGNGVQRVGYINKTGKFEFIDQQGVILDAGDFSGGMARVQIRMPPEAGKNEPRKLWGYLSKSYKLAIKPQFEATRDFVGGVAAVKHEGKWGYINRAGKAAINPTYDDADDFGDQNRGKAYQSTLAMIQLDGRFGFVNRIGKPTIAPQFKEARPFFRSFARGSQEPNFGYFGASGNVMWDPRQPFHVDLLDSSLRTEARVSSSDDHIGSQQLSLPPKRKQPDIPYRPEYLYQDVLPKPGQN